MKKILIMSVLFVSMLGVNAFAEDFITLSGKKITEKQLVENPRTILKFWTTWCPYCRKQLKFIKTQFDKLEKENITIRLVNVGESQEKVMLFAKKMGLDTKYIVLNPSSSLAIKYRIMGFPTYVFTFNGAEIKRANALDSKQIDELVKTYVDLEQKQEKLTGV